MDGRYAVDPVLVYSVVYPAPVYYVDPVDYAISYAIDPAEEAVDQA